MYLVSGAGSMREVTYWVLPASRSEEPPRGLVRSFIELFGLYLRDFPNMLVGYMRVSSDNDRQITDLQRELRGSMLGRDTGWVGTLHAWKEQEQGERAKKQHAKDPGHIIVG